MCRGCKSTPAALLNYITTKPETTRLEFRDVDEGRPLARQFLENHQFHGKGLNYDERKYYHLIVSWPTGCDITDDEMIDISNKILDKFFPDHPAVTAVHDKEELGETSNKHTHSCIDSVSLEKGKMVHMNQKEYTALKDYANELGAEIGFETVDFRAPQMHRTPKAEFRAAERDGKSWKDELRIVIVDAYNDTLYENGTFADFMTRCEANGVKLNDDGKWILKGHMPVGYSRLGDQYRPQWLFNNLTENYLDSIPEELREENRDIERKTPLWAKIMNAEARKDARAAGRDKPKKKLTPEQYEQIQEYRATTNQFWQGYEKAKDLAEKELQKQYQSPENRGAYRNYRRAQYLFKQSFGLVSFTLSIIALVMTKSDLKKEQRRVDHIKELRRELGRLCQESISLKAALKDADQRNHLADNLETELRQQQEAINKRLEEITAELEPQNLGMTAEVDYKAQAMLDKIRREREKSNKYDGQGGNGGDR
jgi:hypothetical protein